MAPWVSDGQVMSRDPDRWRSLPRYIWI